MSENRYRIPLALHVCPTSPLSIISWLHLVLLPLTGSFTFAGTLPPAIMHIFLHSPHCFLTAPVFLDIHLSLEFFFPMDDSPIL